jgi:RecB family endonuclease NucS
MQSFVSLRKTGSGWEFESETVLEEFVWANLQQLLGLTPLKRQYRVSGQICDIVAVDENKRLVVLELKNGEDRYIVQQLTPYYDALLEEKAFNAEIDYGQPVRLVAITPNFHKDNFTDKKYHQLFLEFLQFKIIQTSKKFYLHLEDIDSGKVSKLDIIHQEKERDENLPPPPKKLLNFLDKCDKCSDKQREAVLKIRQKILSFDSRMQEVVKANRIEYGKGKSNPCAELYFRKSDDFGYGLNLFLRLPEPQPYYRKAILRMHILINEDWDSVSGIVNYRRAFISNKNRSQTLYYFSQFIETIKRCGQGETSDEKSRMCYQNYEKLISSQINSLDILVDVALETWLKRL